MSGQVLAPKPKPLERVCDLCNLAFDEERNEAVLHFQVWRAVPYQYRPDLDSFLHASCFRALDAKERAAK